VPGRQKGGENIVRYFIKQDENIFNEYNHLIIFTEITPDEDILNILNRKTDWQDNKNFKSFLTDLSKLDVSRLVILSADPMVLSLGVEKDKDLEPVKSGVLMVLALNFNSEELFTKSVQDEKLEDIVVFPNSAWGINLELVAQTHVSEQEESVDPDDVEEYNAQAEHAKHIEMIKEAFARGQSMGATHMFVVDDFEKERFFIVYVEPNEDPLAKYYSYNDQEKEVQVLETYFFSRPLKEQLPSRDRGSGYDDDIDLREAFEKGKKNGFQFMVFLAYDDGTEKVIYLNSTNNKIQIPTEMLKDAHTQRIYDLFLEFDYYVEDLFDDDDDYDDDYDEDDDDYDEDDDD